MNFESPGLQWEHIQNINEITENNQTDEINETLITTSQKNKDVLQAKQVESISWKTFSVYEEVPDIGQATIPTRWVINEKQTNEKTEIKARPVARGFEESENIQCDPPTASKETLKIFLAVTSTLEWQCETIDVKAALTRTSRGNLISLIECISF